MLDSFDLLPLVVKTQTQTSDLHGALQKAYLHMVCVRNTMRLFVLLPIFSHKVHNLYDTKSPYPFCYGRNSQGCFCGMATMRLLFQ